MSASIVGKQTRGGITKRIARRTEQDRLDVLSLLKSPGIGSITDLDRFLAKRVDRTKRDLEDIDPRELAGL